MKEANAEQAKNPLFLSRSPLFARQGIVLVETLFLLSLVLLILGALAVQTRMTDRNAANRLELMQRVTIAENYHRFLKIALEEDAKEEWTLLWLRKLEKMTLMQKDHQKAKVDETENQVFEVTPWNVDIAKENKEVQRAVKIAVFSQHPQVKRNLLLTSPSLHASAATLERIEFQGWEETGDEAGRMIHVVQAQNVDPEALSLLVSIYFQADKGLWRANTFYRFFFPTLSQEEIGQLIQDEEKRQETLQNYSKEIKIHATGILVKKVK